MMTTACSKPHVGFPFLLVSVWPDLGELWLGALEEVVRVGDVEEVEADERRHRRRDPALRRLVALFQRQSLKTGGRNFRITFVTCAFAAAVNMISYENHSHIR